MLKSPLSGREGQILLAQVGLLKGFSERYYINKMIAAKVSN